MNFSQEMVQEFQLSEVNFDLATPIAAGGAINMVTRSGSNDWHGSGYFFLSRSQHGRLSGPPAPGSVDPNPFFVRRNPGASLGGPHQEGQAFLLLQLRVSQPGAGGQHHVYRSRFRVLTNNYGSPYVSKQISARIDYRINDKEHLVPALFPRRKRRLRPIARIRRSVQLAAQYQLGRSIHHRPHQRAYAEYRERSPVPIQLLEQHTINRRLPSDCSAPCVAGSLPNVYTFLGGNQPRHRPQFQRSAGAGIPAASRSSKG